MSQNIINIEGTNLPDVWYQTLYKAIEVGRDFTIDQGSFEGQVRKEFDFVVLRSKCPGVGELLPKLNPALQLDDPCAQDYLDDYLPYLMTGEENEGEAYTYGQRICDVKLSALDMAYRGLIINDFDKLVKLNIIKLNEEDGAYDFNGNKENIDSWDHMHINQMELMIWTYKNKGYRNNQMVLQVGQPSDMILKDPPCLRHIDTRIQDGALHFYPYFRSWDLWGGLPANLAAIELMKQYCSDQISVENGEIIATSKGLHLYDYVFKIAETVRGRTAEEFKKEMIANSPDDYPNSGDLISSLTAHGIGTFPKDK